MQARTAAQGLVDTLAFVPSIFILGVIFGASAGPAGIGPLAAILMSLVVFSGAGQFAALPLWQQGGGVVVLSALVLSLRFSLMTASMAPLLAGTPPWLRALVAFGVTDENYALAMTRRGGRMEPAYVGGSWLAIYVSWAVGTVIGVLAGARVPEEWRGPLEAVFPIVFLTLLVLVCTSLALAVVAILAAIISVIGALVLPVGWNIALAAIVASLVGPLLGRPARGASP